MHLAEIRVHPIKSCRPVRLERATVERRGLRHDRRYMVVDAAGRFVTLRTVTQLAFVEVAIARDHYAVSLPGGAAFALPHEPIDGPWVSVTVWGDTVRAREQVDAGRALAEWTGLPIRLVGMVDHDSPRPLPDGTGAVSFADAYPLLALSTATVADLSRRVGRPMEIDRFRPNLVIDGTDPYAEDGFGELTVGAIPFAGASLCSRCVATTIDPRTGDRGEEPLRTLAGYRRSGNQVYLGVNLVAAGAGQIAVGDPVAVTRPQARPIG